MEIDLTRFRQEDVERQNSIWGQFADRHGIDPEKSHALDTMKKFMLEKKNGGYTTWMPELTGDHKREHTKLAINFSQDGEMGSDQVYALEVLKVLDFDTTVISTVTSDEQGRITTHHQVIAVERLAIDK